MREIKQSSTQTVKRSEIKLNPYNPKRHTDEEAEKWMPIPGYENYSVSTNGRISNTDTGLYLKPRPRGGYLRVVLYNKNHSPKSFSIHRLVAFAFIPNPQQKPFIDHINTIREDNRVDNLRWVTNLENASNPISRKKHSEGLKGHTVSEECRMKISIANKGKVRSEEVRKKLSKTFKDKYKSGELMPKNTRPVAQYDLSGKLLGIWQSVASAGSELGINNSGIYKCAQGTLKTYKGKIWKYYE